MSQEILGALVKEIENVTSQEEQKVLYQAIGRAYCSSLQKKCFPVDRDTSVNEASEPKEKEQTCSTESDISNTASIILRISRQPQLTQAKQPLQKSTSKQKQWNSPSKKCKSCSAIKTPQWRKRWQENSYVWFCNACAMRIKRETLKSLSQ